MYKNKKGETVTWWGYFQELPATSYTCPKCEGIFLGGEIPQTKICPVCYERKRSVNAEDGNEEIW